MWNFIFAGILIAHGAANISGFFEAFSRKPRSFYDRPWIFSPNVRLQSGIGRIFGIFWLASTILLVGAGVGIILGQAWWITAALAGAIASLLAILPWWNTVVPGARLAALFDIALLVVLLSPLRLQIQTLIGI